MFTYHFSCNKLETNEVNFIFFENILMFFLEGLMLKIRNKKIELFLFCLTGIMYLLNHVKVKYKNKKIKKNKN